ncbi:PAS domain S-box protein [Oscillatoria sp. CS-180]|uniref:PAS domain S-box protein n=1 Tax=Oscillatoria sp. CS-180 TaxID=3021720 RepID=UPI00233110A3|nr:PAS domain S-box protein [Oscillatoria sp. CS-180]MDB9526804.1 PAS domain S-box protein [Oscillatoria sp. CS-180]
MPFSRGWPKFLASLWQARLSRRIVFWVFVSIVVIEAIILVPSVMRREQELLNYLRSLSAAQAEGILSVKIDLGAASDDQVMDSLESLLSNEVILGGALYRADGTLVGTFGDAPELTAAAVMANSNQDYFYNRRIQRYDALWQMSPLEGRYHLIIRHDATWVGREFYAFIGRISGLVLIISVFVTGATMIVLERLVISSVLALRQDLRRVGDTLRQNQDARSLSFASVRNGALRQDELGDVILTFEEMVNQVGAAIAERNQAELDLRLSEEKFSKSFYASPNPMSLSVLETGKLLDVNDSFLALYGAAREAVIGKTAASLSLWDDPSDRAEMSTRLKLQGYLRNQEYRFRTAQGTRRTVLYSAEITQLNGEACILSVANDISERKAAEEALSESEQRFRTLVEQATDALFVVNADRQFIDVNQEACHTLGYSREELLQLSVPDVQKAVSIDDLASDWKLPPGQAVTREGIHQRKDGSHFPVEVRLGRIEIGGKSVLLAIARDITARKQMEQAQARLAEIGELAAMIVHEVRNPLTTVLMGLHSFEQMDLPERAKMRLSFALEESERLQRLLNEILMYARDQHLDLEPLELGPFLQLLCDEFGHQPVAEARSLHTLGLERPCKVMGDRDRLKQVFINLISNACEAAPTDGTVTCSLAVDAHWITAKVHNEGEPIPPDILPQLMQPFFTTKSTGNGLGLAITRRIIEAHEGTIQFSSSSETGTTVTVRIPRHVD